MTELYNREVATHYRSYRPPLHQMILGRALSSGETFFDGLDVGCGTGHSAIALAQHCLRVFGIDPSQSMLDKAMPQAKVTYLKGAGEKIPLRDRAVDVVTFAGSLFYAKSDTLMREIKRVCRHQALAIPYDFEILLNSALQQYGIGSQDPGADYDHNENFSDCAGFQEITVGYEQVSLEVSATEFAHILLSNSHRYEAFARRYEASDPFPALRNELGATNKKHILEANIYFSKYRLDT